jgi:hypothetical protein
MFIDARTLPDRQTLQVDLVVIGGERPGPPAALRLALRPRIRSELIASRATSVGGGILSITEARLGALAYVAASPTPRGA